MVAKKLAVLGAAAATGAALMLGSAAPASALDVSQQIYTAGPLLGLLPALGVSTVTIPLGTLPVVGDATLILDFVPTSGSAVNLYNLINALPFSRRSALSPNTYDRVLGAPADPTNQFPAVAGSGPAARNLIAAYRAQISSVNGNTPPGYTPFQPGAGPITNQTNELLVLLNDSLRPNGGIAARFAPLLNLFGVDTTIPAAGVTTGTGIKLNAASVDVTWAYNPAADFPVTLNPFSLVNSLFAAVPTNLVGGVSLEGVEDTTALGVNVASVLGIINRLSGGIAGVDDGKAWYGTLLPNDLPILEPLRLPSRLINAVFGTDLGTPFADALQPAFTILVNTGYSDVVTPTDIANDPALAEKYQPYDRTFLTSGTPEPFLSVNPLTPAEWVQVPGDVVRALFTGFGDVFLPTAPATPPASVVPSLVPPVSAARTLAAAVEAQPAVVAEDVAAPDPSPVAAPRTDVPNPVVSARKARGAALRAPAAVNAPAEAAAAESRDDAATATADQSRDAATPKRAVRSAARAAE